MLAKLSRTARSVLTLNRGREYRLLRERLALQPNDNLLDIGSGDGFWTVRFARYCAHTVGLEPDEEMLGHAHALHAHAKVEYMQGYAETLPFADSSFDKVVSVSSFEHFSEPLEGLREMYRVLKPGGRLALSVDSLLPENSTEAFRAWHQKRHFVTTYFSEEDLAQMFGQVGFHYEPKRTVHLFRVPLAGAIRKRYIRHPRLWLPVFPFLYGVTYLADCLGKRQHGQILVVTARK